MKFLRPPFLTEHLRWMLLTGDGSNDGTLVNENLFTKLFIISFVSGIMEVCDCCKEFVGYVLLMVFQHWKQKNNRRVLGCLSYHHLEQMRDCF